MTITKIIVPREAAEQSAKDTTVGKALHFILCSVDDPTAITADTPIGQILSKELLPNNGHARASLDTSLATGPAVIWNSTTKAAGRKWEPVIGVTNGNAHSWNLEVLLEGGAATSSTPITALDLATDLLTANAHGLTNGDRVLLTADSGGTLPTATPVIAETTEFFAKAISANTFEVYTEAALTNKVNFTAAGTGNWRVRHARGIIKQVAVHDVGQSISGLSGPTTTTIIFNYTVGTC